MGRRSKSRKAEKALIVFLLMAHLFALSAGEFKRFYIPTKAPQNRSLEIVYRLPVNYSRSNARDCKIMVLFGGRNWLGEKAIKAYDFVKMADKYKLFLIAPSFKNDEYWQPDKWSGKALMQAVNKIKDKYLLNKQSKLIYFGYSAGAQCTALFYSWKPEMVEAWSVYACGVWFKPSKKDKNVVPALVTCGEDDEGRFFLSRRFVQQARECGYPIIWRSYPTGHGLSRKALKLTEQFFSAILSGKTKVEYIGDDQEMQFYPAGSRNARNIDIEYRNNLFNLEFAKLWQKE